MSGERRIVRHAVEALPGDHPLPGVRRRLLNGEHATLAEVRLDAGTVIEPHRHASEQFAWVLEGRLRFDLADGETLEAGAGDVVHIPGDLIHGAVVLEDARVIDVFAPPSRATGLDAAAERS